MYTSVLYSSRIVGMYIVRVDDFVAVMLHRAFMRLGFKVVMLGFLAFCQ